MTLQWRNSSLKILAVLMALLLWIYVTNEQNPVTSQTFTIPLVVQDKPAGYVIDGVPKNVNVRVKGTRSIIGTLERDNFAAHLSLLSVTTGEQEIPVQISSPPGIEVLQITPETVSIQADKIIQKNVPVIVHLKGNVADGMQPGSPVLKPAVVALSGPNKILNELNQVGVTIDVTGVKDTIERGVAVKTGIEGVTVDPSRVTVIVPVSELPSKNLPVRIRLTGEPSAGHVVSNTLVEPSSVQVIGQQEYIQNLTAVSTMTVDITGVSSDIEREVILMLPEGAKTVRPDRVQISVQITPVETEEQPQIEQDNETE